MSDQQKTILFFPLNSPGHINSSLGIADIMKRDFGCRTVFLLLGKTIGSSVEDRGHELITLDEACPFEDFEIDSDEDLSAPVDDEAKIRAGKTKKKFEGVYKWPQLIRRNSSMFKLEPLECFVASAEIMEKLMVGELVENHENYAKAIENIRPDLIIIDAYYVPPCIVKSTRPWVRLYSANPLALVESKLDGNVRPAPMIGFALHDKQTRLRMREEQPDQWQKMLTEWRDAMGKIIEAMSKAGGLLGQFMREHGCEPPPFGKQAHDSPHLNVYMYPEALDYEQDDDLFEYPKLWLRCDSLMRQSSLAGSKENKELREWIEKFERAKKDKEAVIFFSLGSLASGDYKLMERFVRFLSRDQKRLYVVSKGVNGHRYELDDGNMIGDNYIPQTYFLQKSDLAIIHGGNNSITECMYYGKPMIVLPVFADQLDNAQRAEDLKLGRRLDIHKVGQDELLTAIDEILSDEQMIERTRKIGEGMHKRDDLKKVTNLLIKLTNEGSLAQEDINRARN